MLSEAEKEVMVFRTLRLIDGLDKADEYFDFKVVVLADEVSHILTYDQLMFESRRLYMNQLIH